MNYRHASQCDDAFPLLFHDFLRSPYLLNNMHIYNLKNRFIRYRIATENSARVTALNSKQTLFVLYRLNAPLLGCGTCPV